MALTYRIINSKQLQSCVSSFFSFQQRRCVTMMPSKVTIPSGVSHDEKNAILHRPQSPHLTIYKMQLTSLLSITHRMTGVALGTYLTTLGIGTLVSSGSFPDFIDYIHQLQLSPAVIMAAKAMIAFPFAYHVCNGMRHLAWDLGKALTIKGVYSTGYAMLAGSALITAWLLSL